MIRFLLIVICCNLFLFAGCNNSEHKDISDIKVDFKSYNLYQDLLKIDTNNISGDLKDLEKTYKDFLPFFFKEIVAVRMDSGYNSIGVRQFLTYKDFRNLFDTVAIVFPNTESLNSQIKSLFQHIKYYDSSIAIPNQVIYYVAGLHEAAFTWDSTLGVGLDMYLGQDFGPYQAVGIPGYLSKNFKKELIPLSVTKVMFQNKYGIDFNDKTLLELMVYEGKKNLFLKAVLPQYQEHQIFGFTEAQWDWCVENESLIYNFFGKQELIYENSPMKIMRYVSPAPTSMGMPEQSPGYTAGFIGYQIIKAYQDKTNLSIAQILADSTKAQDILRKSNYRPKK